MSKRNKKSSKIQRRLERMSKPAFEREEPAIPHDVSISVLTDCKAKNSGTFRRSMLQSRGRVIQCPVTDVIPAGDQIISKAARLNMRQLANVVRRSPIAVRRLQTKLKKTVLQQVRNELQTAMVYLQFFGHAAQTEIMRRTKVNE